VKQASNAHPTNEYITAPLHGMAAHTSTIKHGTAITQHTLGRPDRHGPNECMSHMMLAIQVLRMAQQSHSNFWAVLACMTQMNT
jgi:hypothetical protein